jgi:hypothetical protein
LFSFADAGKIAKVINGLKATAALGTNRIPVTILKMGFNVLAGPISHLLNMCLAAGIVSEGFNTAHSGRLTAAMCPSFCDKTEGRTKN